MFLFGRKKEKKEKIDRETIRRFSDKEIKIIDYLPEGILIFNEYNKISLANIQIENIFNVREEKLIGKAIFELNQSPAIKKLGSFLGVEIYKGGKKKLKIEDNLILEVAIIPIFSEEGKRGTLVILYNITEKELVSKVKAEFIDLATHELWTPTSAIKWSLKMLLEGEFGGLNKKQEDFVRKIYETNNKAIKLIGDLLEVAQIEGEDYFSDLKLSNIGYILESSIDKYRKKMKERKIRFNFKKTKEELPEIMVNEGKIRIAIENILSNAVEYTPSGGQITVLLGRDKKEIKIQISDTGLGIPEQQQGRVFTKFFRGSNIIQKETEGTGLGLYIAKNIINGHGGKIWFISEEGKGTTFYLTLPIKKRFAEFITGKFY